MGSTRIAVAAAAFLAAASVQAADPPRSGEQIVKARCIECHGTGKHGAPRIDDREAWNPRLKKGLDATVMAAMRGHGAMPARGGMAELTDAEFRSAVIYLFNSQYVAGKPARPKP